VTVVTGGAGNDTFNVGSNAPATGGTVDGIQGCLHFDGGGGSSDALNVDDTGDASDNIGTLDSSSLMGLDMGSGGIGYSNVENMHIGLGSGDDSVRLNDTGAITVIDGDGGDDSFVIGPDVDDDGVPIGDVVN